MARAAVREPNRRQYLGGSDARIIMSPDEAVLIRLWQEKRGEVDPADLSGDLIVQLGVATEALNRNWYERNTGRSVTDVQRWVQHPVHRHLTATLDGFVNDLDAVFEDLPRIGRYCSIVTCSKVTTRVILSPDQ
jgi:predicted phage-related endonuclease